VRYIDAPSAETLFVGGLSAAFDVAGFLAVGFFAAAFFPTVFFASRSPTTR
jgi:hypothetical protein